ncbi:hypothetical protein PG993_008917 [Apiospora rasikravindrae]|uniref:Flavin reductase like domain-containing protein n=1 Tax=Apiospora rasikravindrae TaxID=990691 RepID=A0ABR1SS11_9PEZI
MRNLPEDNRLKSHKISDDHFKKLMRHVPRPAVVVTSVHYPQIPGRSQKQDESHNGPDDVGSPAGGASVTGPTPRAMTVSSFSSVTLDPRPTITFSITKPSRTYDAIANCRRFNIHVLRDDETGARLAHHFTKGNAPTSGASHNLFNFDKFPELNVRLAHGREDWEQSWQNMLAEGSDSAAATPLNQDSAKGTPSGVPCLQGDSVLYVLRCVVASKPEGAHGGGLIDVGGSAIIVGEIEDFIHMGDGPDVAPTPPHDAMSLTYAHQEYRKMGDKLDHGEPQKPS